MVNTILAVCIQVDKRGLEFYPVLCNACTVVFELSFYAAVTRYHLALQQKTCLSMCGVMVQSGACHPYLDLESMAILRQC